MSMPIDAPSTQPSLAARQIRQGRTYTATMEPQRPDPAARADARGASRERIAPRPPSSQVQAPSIRVDYQQDQPVLMLHDRRGVLIYQIPSRGELQLVQLEDARSRGLSERA